MDYKKKYEEVLNRAKGAHNSAKSDKENGVTDKITEYTIQLTETIFPELKESEDEKIRKAIEYAIGQSTHSDGTLINEVSSEEALTWVEEQVKHNNFRNKIQIGDKVTRNKDGVLVNLSQLEREAKPAEKQGSQILANSCKTCKDEQKPAWSEEDEEAFHCLEYTVKHYYDDKDTISKCCSWLKSLKERVQSQNK